MTKLLTSTSPAIITPSPLLLSPPTTDPFDDIDVNWANNYEFRVYGDAYCNVYAVVDEEDWRWAIQWCWNVKFDKHKRKRYLYRTVKIGGRGGANASLYFHVEIMKRTGVVPPSPAHTITDHGDGDSLHCRRRNLSWATPSMNRRNINGQRGLATW